MAGVPYDITDEELADILDGRHLAGPGERVVPWTGGEVSIGAPAPPAPEVRVPWTAEPEVVRADAVPSPDMVAEDEAALSLAHRYESDRTALEAREAADEADRLLRLAENYDGNWSTGLGAPSAEFRDARARAREDLADAEAAPRPLPGGVRAPAATSSTPIEGAVYPTATAAAPGLSSDLSREMTRSEVTGEPMAGVVEMPGRSLRVGGRGRGGGAPAAPALSGDELLIEALSGRPRGDGPLFAENSETPLDRSLGRAAEMSTLAARRAESEASGYAAAGDAIRGAERARADLENQRVAAMTTARDRYRAALDFAASQTIDPEGWYHDRGAVGTIMGAISVALGSLGGTLSGSGGNAALDIINESISRDLEAQRSRIDAANTRAAGEGTLLDLMAQEFVSREAALAASRAAMLEDAANRVAEEGAMMDVTESGIAGRELHDQLIAQAQAAQAEAERAEAMATLDLLMRQAEVRTAMAEADRAERRGTGTSYATPTDALLSTANRLIDTGNDPAAVAASLNLDPALLGGSSRFAESSTADSAANVSALSRALDNIEALLPGGIRGPGGGFAEEDVPGVGMTGALPDFLVSDEGADLRVEIDNAVDLLGRIRSGGAISADEFASFRRILRGAGTDRALRAGLERIRAEIDARTNRNREGDTMDADVDGFLASLGATPVDDTDDVADALDEPGVNR